jgi:hypothetical protein
MPAELIDLSKEQCLQCGGELDTGYECIRCGWDGIAWYVPHYESPPTDDRAQIKKGRWDNY